MTVKEIINIISDCPPEAAVSIAISDGVQFKIMPASQMQVLVNEIDGRKTYNMMFVAVQDKKK